MKRVLVQQIIRVFVLGMVFCGVSQTSFATTVIMPTDDNLIIGSRAIVRGRVLAIESAIESNSDRIFTYITLRVQEVLKGQISERRIVLKQRGGEVAGRGTRIFGMPQFLRDENVILYLDTWAEGAYRVHQMFLGKFTILTDARTGQQIAQRSQDEDVQVITSGHQMVSETDITNSMELTAYLQMVRQKVAANRERSLAFEQQHYAGVPRLARPVEYDGLVRNGQVESQWTYIGGARPRWFEPDDGQPVVFMVNPAGAPNQQITNDVAAAMSAWSSVPGCSLRLANGGSTQACNPADGLNTIIFNNCDHEWSASSGCQGVLAIGGLSWYPGTTRVINGVTFVKGTAGFISFNPYAACNFGISCNVQEVTTHELGHTLGLGHSADTSATMAAFAHFDGRCASLRADDIAGITFIYPGQGGGPGPLTVTTSSLPTANVASPYSQTVLASGGQTPYTWSLASGSLPAGLQVSSTGAIAGTPTTTGTASFTVQVRDAAQATAQQTLSITVNPAGTNLPFAAQFVSQSVPTSLQPGQAFTANMKFLNTGTQTWSGANFYLASQNPPLNQFWGGNGVPLGQFVVAPGQLLDVTFNASAPPTPGNYNFQWQMYQVGGVLFFGDISPNIVIQVGSAPPPPPPPPTNNADFVSQDGPSTMTAGQTYSITVVMRNSGTSTWSPTSHRLGSQNPQDNTTWGTHRVSLSSSVAPGATAPFTFNVTAPTTPGTYNCQWKMVQEGVEWFGAASTNLAINVTGGSSCQAGGTDNSQFMSQDLRIGANNPGGQVVTNNRVTAGGRYTYNLNFKNTGSSYWNFQNGYELGTQNPTVNTVWGKNKVEIGNCVAPGTEPSPPFGINLIAPPVAGKTYNLQWQVYKNGLPFGVTSTNLAFTVDPDPNDRDNDGIPNSLEAGVGKNQDLKDNNVLESSTLFINQMYRDFLYRERGTSDGSYWVDELNRGVSRAEVVARFFEAPEFYLNKALLIKLYQQCFGRLPDYEGIRYWLDEAAANRQTREQIANAFVNSSEFQRKYGTLTNEQFIQRLYQNALNRLPNQSELASWVAQLNSRSRGAVAVDIAGLSEYDLRLTVQVQIVELYLVMLLRMPTTDEYNYWIQNTWANVNPADENQKRQKRIEMANTIMIGTAAQVSSPYKYRERFYPN